MIQDKKKVLVKCGLSPREADLYLALLPLGSASSSLLGNKTKISRNLARYTCHQLVKKGVFHKIQKGNTLLFTPESPEKFTYLFEQKRREIDEQENELSRISGELKAMINPQTILPRVRFYEGIPGMIQLYEQVLSVADTVDSFEDSGEMMALIPDYVPIYVQKRVESKIPARTICPSSNEINLNELKLFLQTRKIDREKFPFSCDIKICADQVSIFSFKETTPVGIAIHHEDIANNFRILFEQLWKSLEPINQQNQDHPLDLPRHLFDNHQENSE